MKITFSITKAPRTPRKPKELNSFEALGVVSVLVMGSAFFNAQPLSEGMPT
jgi:hemolysin-activating ACP:hemolysin acyltransferase